MKIKNAQYLLTAVKPEQYPEKVLPAITFLGRSNVGKSSLINTLTNRKKMARTSSQPGKTRTINFYDIDNIWYLVDLPGYGFAKVSRDERNSWKRMIEKYMDCYKGETFYLLLVDIRHAPSVKDVEMWNWLLERGEACGVVATKADKISRGARGKNLSVIAKMLGIDADEILVFSSVTREGKDDLLDAIEACLESIEEDEEPAAENTDELV